MSEQIRALGLLSGGLDSTLAARVMQEQGVEVLGLHFSTGFCLADRHRVLGNRSNPDKPYRNEALRAGADLSVPIEIIDVKDEYLPKVVLNPQYGYGSGMNPCIDCRIFMLQKTKDILEDRGYDFVFTGEVLGQRPMSQRRPPLNDVAADSGLGRPRVAAGSRDRARGRGRGADLRRQRAGRPGGRGEGRRRPYEGR